MPEEKKAELEVVEAEKSVAEPKSVQVPEELFNQLIGMLRETYPQVALFETLMVIAANHNKENYGE